MGPEKENRLKDKRMFCGRGRGYTAPQASPSDTLVPGKITVPDSITEKQCIDWNYTTDPKSCDERETDKEMGKRGAEMHSLQQDGHEHPLLPGISGQEDDGTGKHWIWGNGRIDAITQPRLYQNGGGEASYRQIRETINALDWAKETLIWR